MVCEQERAGDGHIVFVGLGNGQIQEFRMSRDLNRFEKRRTFHSELIDMLLYCVCVYDGFKAVRIYEQCYTCMYMHNNAKEMSLYNSLCTI